MYVGARSPESVRGRPNVVPLHLDLVRPETISRAAHVCDELSILVNNAGIMLGEPLLGARDPNAAEREMQVNFFGTLRMIRAFAPVLGRQKASVIVNVLSIVARVNAPRIGSYCASKAAALSLTQAARAELASQNTRLIAVMPGFVDTDMAQSVTFPKLQPEVVAQQIIAAIHGDDEDIYPGPAAEVATRLGSAPKEVEREFAQLFDRAPRRAGQ